MQHEFGKMQDKKVVAMLVRFPIPLELSQAKVVWESYDQNTKNYHKLHKNNYLCTILISTLYLSNIVDPFGVEHLQSHTEHYSLRTTIF